ncbi:MAG TPA: L-serine ammonia-lyase [Clostridiales bacterium]|nr:L-serine ammonia-lyase [Clostridiales bacterium]
MESLTELYRIGRGPSSSHTIGPERACRAFAAKYPQADAFRAVLYGSLAKTGKGHGTDRVIEKTLPRPCTVVFDPLCTDLPHPNTMELYALRGGEEIGHAVVASVGGGRIRFLSGEIETADGKSAPLVYRETQFSEIAALCKKEGIRLPAYVRRTEGDAIDAYIATVWETMQACIARGLADEGILPGGLGVAKKAKILYRGEQKGERENAASAENRLVCAYAFAVGEQNASGETVVTAPTCGAAGVLPAVLFYQKSAGGYSDREICDALLTAGVVGNLIKTNASISGAECGCQVEIGSACAMAAAALSELWGEDLEKIECAAEIAIEHHLGLTCDPIGGLVQIPCIERNAVAAMRAINAARISTFLSDLRKISLDSVIVTMRETGRDIACAYRETSEGGLAKTNRELFRIQN